jgi:hypothetical protein
MIEYVIMSVAVALFTGFTAKVPVPSRPRPPDDTGASNAHVAGARGTNWAELVQALADEEAVARPVVCSGEVSTINGSITMPTTCGSNGVNRRPSLTPANSALPH